MCDCFAQNDASVKCWGYNYYGQLGLGDTIYRGNNGFGEYAPLKGGLVGSEQPKGQGLWLMKGQSRRVSEPGRCVLAEMGANLTAVDLGPGMTAVSIAAGYAHVCVILVR